MTDYAFKNYYDALARRKPEQAANYLSDSCKYKLAKRPYNKGRDMNQIVQETLMPDFKSYKIGKIQRIGDSLLLAVKVTTIDGTVFIVDKDQVSNTISGGNRENGVRISESTL